MSIENNNHAQSSTDTTGMVELDDEQLEAVAGGKASPVTTAMSAATGGLSGASPKPYITPQPVFTVPSHSRGEVEWVKQTQQERHQKIEL